MGFRVLGIDASGPSLSVGYIEDQRVLADLRWERPRSASRQLVPWIHSVVEEFGRPLGVAVGIGPGSFTGVRIALSAAKAYAVAWQVPLIGVSSLKAWAYAAPPGERVLVTSEPRGQAFYLGYYWRGTEEPEPLTEDMAINGTLPARFPLSERAVVLGALNQDAGFMRRLGTDVRPLEVPLLGSSVALLGRIGLQWGQHDDPMVLAPAYLRSPVTT